LLLSEDEKIDYIRHIIHVESEVRFINQLEAYLKEDGNLFASFDWWMFSRTDETLDRIVIPYYDPSQNKMREFHPDFIFWLRRWNDYYILFVDPKGMQNIDYQYKIDDYKNIFTDPKTGTMKVIPYNGLNVRVALAMYNKDASSSPQGYGDYWYDHPRHILKNLISSD
jgi:type III restriction enzyme